MTEPADCGRCEQADEMIPVRPTVRPPRGVERMAAISGSAPLRHGGPQVDAGLGLTEVRRSSYVHKTPGCLNPSGTADSSHSALRGLDPRSVRPLLKSR